MKGKFFNSWYLSNKDKILGREVDEVYYDYCEQAQVAGQLAYYKQTFIGEINYRLNSTTKKVFIKIEDVFSP